MLKKPEGAIKNGPSETGMIMLKIENTNILKICKDKEVNKNVENICLSICDVKLFCKHFIDHYICDLTLGANNRIKSKTTNKTNPKPKKNNNKQKNIRNQEQKIPHR
jgi:hypothetical protein